MTMESFADEEWRAIAGANNGHEISSYGRVRNANGRLRTLMKHKLGYLHLSMMINGEVKNKNVHRLVAEAFLEPSELDVDHIDGNKANNHVSNLRYLSKKDNVVSHFAKKYKYIGTLRHGKRWKASTVVRGTRVDIGIYESREEASVAYKKYLIENKSEAFTEVA